MSFNRKPCPLRFDAALVRGAAEAFVHPIKLEIPGGIMIVLADEKGTREKTSRISRCLINRIDW